MTKTMTARYRGVCIGCFGPIVPGDEINYGGKNQTRHTDCEREHGVVIVQNASGDVIATRNRRGRCEDAPCCGCCT